MMGIKFCKHCGKPIEQEVRKHYPYEHNWIHSSGIWMCLSSDNVNNEAEL